MISMTYLQCPLTETYWSLIKPTNRLVAPDKDIKASESKNAKELKELREWLDSFDISYKVTQLKADIFRGVDFDDILASLPEEDRSCRVTFRNVYVEKVATFCNQYCKKIPSDATIRKWLRSDKPYKSIKRYVERTNKRQFSGRVQDFLSLPTWNID